MPFDWHLPISHTSQALATPFYLPFSCFFVFFFFSESTCKWHYTEFLFACWWQLLCGLTFNSKCFSSSYLPLDKIKYTGKNNSPKTNSFLDFRWFTEDFQPFCFKNALVLRLQKKLQLEVSKEYFSVAQIFSALRMGLWSLHFGSTNPESSSRLWNTLAGKCGLSGCVIIACHLWHCQHEGL